MPTGLLTISQYTANPPQQVDVNSLLEVRGWYNRDFIAGDGVTPIYGNATNGEQGPYYSTTPTLNADGDLVVPAHEVQATTLSRPTANYFEGLWVDGAFTMMLMPNTNVATGWQIPTTYGDPIAYDEIATYNRAKTLVPPPGWYDIMIQEIERIAGDFAYAAVGVNGITSMSYAPDVASLPIAMGDNDPRMGSWYNILTYGARTTNTAAQNTVFIAAAVAAATFAGGGIFIPVGNFPVNTLSITVPTWYAPGGSMLRPAAAQVVTHTKPVIADPSQHFNLTLGGSGSVLLTGTIDPIYASWFGDVAVDLGPPLSAAIAAIAAVGGEIKLSRSAMDLLTSVNATGITAQRLKISGYGRGSLITAKTTGQPAMDFTGSQFVELEDFIMSGSSTLTPNVGLLFARISPGSLNSAGINHLYNLEIQGYFSIAPLYNYGSEEFRAYDCHFENFKDGAVYAGVFTADNDMGVTSPYKTISTGAVSMIDFMVCGCAWECFDTTWLAECLYLRGVVGFASYSSFFAIDRAKTFVHYDSEISCVNVDFMDTRLDSPGVQGVAPNERAYMATYGFLLTGELPSAYVTINQTFDQGVLSTTAGGFFTAASIAVDCEITTTSAHQLSVGQEVVITGVTGTLGAAINGPRTVATRVSEFKYTIGVDTSGLVGVATAGYGGGRSFYAESPTVAHPSGSNILALALTQYNSGFGSVRPYVFLYSGDNCQIDVSVGGAIECATNTGVGSPAITNSSLQVPIANLILGRPDFCLKNNVFDYTGGGLLVGRRVAAKTAAYTVGGQDVDTLFTNTGASGSVTFTLPTPSVGMTYEFYRDANFNVVVDVGVGVVIQIGTSATSAGGAATLAAVGSRLRITAITTTLWVGDSTGNVTYA